MDWATTLGTLSGGIGLFLLGMSMMTDGLKLAAGPALERVLASGTRTRWHALGSGVLVTGVVQSSSAVTVATIGFVNAGLLGLGGALWVLFGANVGTTMTGWIVALLGMKFKIEALSLPLIGVGVVLRLTGTAQRRGALGTALAGFGLLFLGIAMLQTAFAGLAERVALPQDRTALSVVSQLGVGVVLTVAMQSSSAAMTIALAAAQGGLLSPHGAAAVVIGANIGTTATAILAAIGATSNAKRAAAAHVAFNVLTGAVALLMLPWLVDAIEAGSRLLELPADPASQLALFHTVFNVMGVLLIWPIADRLTHWLKARFRSLEEDEGAPRYLDDTVLAVPDLAVEALGREVRRIGAIARRSLREACAGAGTGTLAADREIVGRLVAAADRFVEGINRAAMPADTVAHVANWLRILRYHEGALEQAVRATAGAEAATGLSAALSETGLRLLDALDAEVADAAAWAAAEAAYQAIKQDLLSAGAAGTLSVTGMDAALRRAAALRQALWLEFRAAEHAAPAREGASAAASVGTDTPDAA